MLWSRTPSQEESAVAKRLRASSTFFRFLWSVRDELFADGFNESFNGKFRDECLNAEWFPTRREAVVVIEAYRRHYNEARPHSALGYRTPSEFAALERRAC